MDAAVKQHIETISKTYPGIAENFGPAVRADICTSQVYAAAMGQDSSIPFERIKDVSSQQLAAVKKYFNC